MYVKLDSELKLHTAQLILELIFDLIDPINLLDSHKNVNSLI